MAGSHTIKQQGRACTALLLALLHAVHLVGCSEFNLNPSDDSPGGGQSVGEDEIQPDPDDNSDDCVERRCDLDWFDGYYAGATFDCAMDDLEPPEDPWALEVMWDSPSLLGFNLGTVIFDVNGDGISDVVGISYDSVIVHDGRDGSILHDLECWYGSSSGAVAAADVDGDGEWEFFAACLAERDWGAYGWDLVRWTADGVEEWRAPLDLGHGAGGWAMDIADLDGDGFPEVVTNMAVMDAETGEVLHYLVDDDYNCPILSIRNLVVADITGDGSREVIAGGTAWDADGALLWEVGPESWAKEGVMSAAVAGPGETEPLLFIFGAQTGVITNAVGEDLDQFEIEERLAGPGVTCAGDINGDGEMEVVQVGRWEVNAFNLQGQTVWTAPIYDTTHGSTGCTTFDFDLDGAREVILSDMISVRILDGTTGTTLWADYDWHTGTAYDVPLVADLDGDGSVELIMTNSSGPHYYPGIRVYRNANRDWPPGGRAWPSATWSGTSLNSDGTVPRRPATPWTTTRVWNGQPGTSFTGSDLSVEIADYCIACCDILDAEVNLAVRVVNGGPDELRESVPVSAYKVNEDGTSTWLKTITIDEYVPVGYASGTSPMRLKTRDVLPGLLLVAGDDGSGVIVVDDCNLANNQLTWCAAECGGGK